MADILDPHMQPAADTAERDRLAKIEAQRVADEAERKRVADKSAADKETERRRAEDARIAGEKPGIISGLDTSRTFDPPGVRTDEPIKPGTFSGRPSDPSVSPAKGQIRAFEDRHFGKNAVRINGHVERGFGSPFKEMSIEKQAEYAALEAMVVAEQAVADASSALEIAKVAHEAAKAKLDNMTKVAHEAAAEAKRDADHDAAAEKPVQQKAVAPSPSYAPAPPPRLDAFGKPLDPAHKGL